MTPLLKTIEDLITPSILTLGYEFVGMEFNKSGKYSTLKIYIDSEKGITVDDCGSVSRQVSSILDVEDPINSQYTLEVSSPGIERPLFKIADYQRFLGCEIKIRLRSLQDGKRKLVGEISKVNENESSIDLLSSLQNFTINLNNIDKANLTYNL